MQHFRSKLASLTSNNLKFEVEQFTETNYSYSYIIPNNGNGNLSYLYITDGTIYICSKDNDFCLEIEQKHSLNETIFEGFLYKCSDTFTFQVSDILYKNSKKIEEKDYHMRYFLISQLLHCHNLQSLIFKDINTTFTIDIAPFFYKNEPVDDLSKFNKFYKFFNNYLYISSINSHLKFSKTLNKQIIQKKLRIIKGEKTEIYYVVDDQTNNHLGILYVPSLSCSRYLKDKFKESGTEGTSAASAGRPDSGGRPEGILHLCNYNYQFDKWELILPPIDG